MSNSKLSFFSRIKIFSLAICIIPVLLVTGYAVTSSITTLKKVLADELKAKSSLVGNEIDKFFTQRTRDIKEVSQADVLESNDNESKSKYLQEIIEANPEFSDYIVLDNNKSPTSFAAENSYGKNWSEVPESLKELINKTYTGNQGDVFLTDAIKTKHGTAVFLTTPITGDDNIVVVGALVGEVSMKSIDKLIEKFDDSVIGDKSVYLLNDDGKVISTADSSHELYTTFRDLNVYPDVLRATDVDGAVGSEIYVDAAGDEVIAGLADMEAHGVNEALDWGIIAIAEVEAIAKPAMILARNIVIMSLVIMLVGWLFLHFGLKKFKLSISEHLDNVLGISNYSRANAENLQKDLSEKSQNVKGSRKGISYNTFGERDGSERVGNRNRIRWNNNKERHPIQPLK